MAPVRSDWDDFRVFLAVARHGSLSAAARLLGIRQPTVGRKISAFQRRLGTQLFARTARGFSLTPSGTALLAHVERMEHEAVVAERAVAGRDDALRGAIRITASEWIVVRLLAPLLAPFVRAHPNIVLDIVADAKWLSLPRREADVALRPAAFEHAEVYQRCVARVAFGLYASEWYLTHNGTPDFATGCEGHVLLNMIDEETPIADIAWAADAAPRARVAVRSNGRESLASLAAAGVGLACLPHAVGDAIRGLVRIETPRPPPERKLYLGVHRDTRNVPRVKAVVAFLATAFAGIRDTLSGRG